eukprot:CAMPEP_0194389200 /NCGR_PEP_ID=MMETSP0174-20130528/102776_1 /TAXON_ID=216777 /ORGANISM="Proboscia alata, Strain PI-D3" /LENGTH=323 /DNA_ID=CAMNT_0039181233 /DNA_START=82 /DNA_END=1053 /DNA_ORIENTATION=+
MRSRTVHKENQGNDDDTVKILGKSVMIHSTTRSDLNGRRGYVSSYIPPNDRYLVHLDDDNNKNQQSSSLTPTSTPTLLSLKATNFEVIEQKTSQKEKLKASQSKKSVSLWKSTGRMIRKNYVGKVVLDGIGGGIDGVQKGVRGATSLAGEGINVVKHALAIGVGDIQIQISELKVYRQHEKVKGVIHLNLREPMEANSLEVILKGCRTRDTYTEKGHTPGDSVGDESRTEEIVVCETNYTIEGKRIYPCQATFPFEVIIPQLTKTMSQNTKGTLVGGIVSAVSTIQAYMESPIVWSLDAQLHCASTLYPLYHSTGINVAEEEY